MANHPKYVIYQDRAGEYRFRLTARNGQTILQSEGYTGKAGCRNGIQSVRTNSPLDERYERRTATNGQSYFNLKAGNNQVIGSSEMYGSAAARDAGIQSVKNNGPIAEEEDREDGE